MNLKTLLHNLSVAFKLESLKRNHHRILAMLTVYPLIAALFGSWFDALVFTLGCIALVDFILRHYLNALAARIEAKNSPTWDVEVNQVKVGAITDSEYAAIRHRVFSNGYLYYTQAMNIFRVAINSFDYCYRAIPLCVFWIVIALAVFSPDSLTETVAAIQHATASEIKQAVSTAGRLLILTMVLTGGFHWVLGLSHFGYINRFDEAVATNVRQHCSVAAEGLIVLSRWTSDGPVFNNETAFLRNRN
jgi:hypothetical protein